MAEFLNRTEELQMLDRLWSSNRAELLVLFGRRRIGKTKLLAHFADGRRTIHLEATDVREPDQLRDFASAYAEGLDLGPLPLHIESWEQALELVARASVVERTLVVLDEFQYLAKQNPGLGSILSRWWRRVGSSGNLVLVLSGSDVSFFADEVLGATGALHGRRTADYQMQPFAPASAPLFFPSWSPEDRVRAFAVWGGVPYYLSFIDEERTLEQNIFSTVFCLGAPLANEADYLIRMESRLRDVTLYGSILRAIASGATKLHEVSSRLGPGSDTSNVSGFVDRLEALRLVRRERPVVGGRRQDVTLQIEDPFLRFWYRFVAPAGARLSTADGARKYLQMVVMPELDRFASAPVFEQICRLHLQREVDAAAVGRWWGPVTEPRDSDGRLTTIEREADAVAIDDHAGVLAIGTCKWTNAPVAFDEVVKLGRVLARLKPGLAVPVYVYARSGVDEAIAKEAAGGNVRVIAPADLYEAKAGAPQP